MRKTTSPSAIAYYTRFRRAVGLTPQEHAQALYNSPCIPSTARALEYAAEVHGATLKASAVRKAVKDGGLSAYKIGAGFHFSPADVDAWLESLRTAASA